MADRISFLERIRLLREYNSYRRDVRRANPSWSEEEVCTAALDQMKAIHGESSDWSSVLQMILEFLMKLLPFFFLADEA